MQIEKTNSKQPVNWLMAYGLGLGIMYILDPERGHRRRAIMRDQLVHLNHQTINSVDVVGRDLVHRTVGLVAVMRSFFSKSEVSDDVLVARVRSKLGRMVTHPHSIEVTAASGHVLLKGTAFRNEVDNMISLLSRVRGVRSIAHQLGVHDLDHQKNLHSLNAHPMNWSPATRAAVGVLGSAVFGYGVNRLKRRELIGVPLSGLGAIVFFRSVSNRQIQGLLKRSSSKSDVA